MARLEPGIHAEQVKTGRVQTNILSTGRAEGQPVLFVHGNVSSALFWQETLLALPEGFRGLAADLRGFGDTEARPIEATRGLRDFADDLAALVEVMNLAPLHLVGWSMGGGVVMQYLIDHPDQVRSLTLIAPISPYGYGSTRGAGGQLSYPDAAGSGGGTANPDFVKRLKDGERGTESPNSPRNVMNSIYFKPPFRARLEETYVESMLSTRVGDDFYPGNMRPSQNWPNVAPGDRGILNAMAPIHLNLSRLVEVTPKAPLLWIRGADDAIVSDLAMTEFGALGKLGIVPGWPGEEVFPPQPMITQTRAVLDRYRANGGEYWEEVFADTGHSPHVEQPERFQAHFFKHLHFAGKS